MIKRKGIIYFFKINPSDPGRSFLGFNFYDYRFPKKKDNNRDVKNKMRTLDMKCQNIYF